MRDQKEIPRVLERCADVIEQHLDSMGIYRLSGTTSKVQRLKAALDQGTHTLRALIIGLHMMDSAIILLTVLHYIMHRRRSRRL